METTAPRTLVLGYLSGHDRSRVRVVAVRCCRVVALVLLGLGLWATYATLEEFGTMRRWGLDAHQAMVRLLETPLPYLMLAPLALAMTLGVASVFLAGGSRVAAMVSAMSVGLVDLALMVAIAGFAAAWLLSGSELWARGYAWMWIIPLVLLAITMLLVDLLAFLLWLWRNPLAEMPRRRFFD